VRYDRTRFQTDGTSGELSTACDASAESSSLRQCSAMHALERVYGRGDLSQVDDLFATDYIEHDPASPHMLHGPASVKQFVSMYRRAFPDLRLAVAERVIEGDTVLLHWMGRGTHLGTFQEMEPTSKRVALKGTTITRLDHGRAVEGWSNWEFGALPEQLDLWPHSIDWRMPPGAAVE
jgi:predicted ester cyclase